MLDYSTHLTKIHNACYASLTMKQRLIEYNDFLTVDRHLNMSDYLVRECTKWCRKLNLKIKIRKDNRITGMNEAHWTGEICVNNTKFNINREAEFLRSFLHELFHIKMKHEGEESIDNEYTAENFAIKIIKKFYPEDYQKLVYSVTCWINCLEYKKLYPIHTTAFARISDYK